jgi:hypothetical protein
VVDDFGCSTCLTPPANLLHFWPGNGNLDDVVKGKHAQKKKRSIALEPSTTTTTSATFTTTPVPAQITEGLYC